MVGRSNVVIFLYHLVFCLYKKTHWQGWRFDQGYMSWHSPYSREIEVVSENRFERRKKRPKRQSEGLVSMRYHVAENDIQVGRFVISPSHTSFVVCGIGKGLHHPFLRFLHSHLSSLSIY